MNGSVSEQQRAGLIACHCCDLLHVEQPVSPGVEAYCVRCGTRLYRRPRGGMDAPLALFLAALLFFMVTSSLPLLTLQWNGREITSSLITGALAFFDQGMEVPALLVLLTGGLIPLLTVLAALWILIPLRLNRYPWHGRFVLRGLQWILPWGMLGVYLLGMVVAMIKLIDMATVIPGPAFYSFVGLLITIEAGRNILEPRLLWQRMESLP